ncbi:DNRLRE domain-containing protein [Paenibacillus sp. YN15]|uniref:CBM96 family carbohydrate-binding protein n=1 Tax=Paenibacillus sp. YN15 TaxID=1742774 RepID=UPI000DCB39A2|nr:DNRLRE domain-containing protein [Paenibacillus sp. YN15]RAU91326.1 hypothetical protein DQG13_29600 [Paenibacillus sp. YN15]
MKKIISLLLCMTLVLALNMGIMEVQTVHAADETGITYYADSMSGDDANDGQTEETAWRSLEKLNTVEFQPGDKLLLKTDSIWNGQLRPLGSGTEGNPIVIDVYGTGGKPIINGNGTASTDDEGQATVSGAVMLVNQSYWEINNIEVTNFNNTVTSSRAGILVKSSGETRHIYVRNTYVHDVNSDPDGKKVTGGIMFDGEFHDVLAEGNYVKNVAIEGIRNANGTNKASTDVVFRNNYVEEVLGDGIVLAAMKSGGIVERNVVKNFVNTDVGNRNYAGIWVYASNNTLFQYNEAFGGKYGYNDGEAFDIDLQCQNTTFQYNYSHNNRGGFALFMNGSTNSVFRYNISVNDGPDTEIFFYGPSTEADTPEIYNNTIITGTSSRTKIFNSWSASATMKFYNNLIYGGQTVQFANYPVKGEFANNSVYPASILAVNGPAEHPGVITANPQLANPWVEVTGLANTDVYKLRSNSPLIDAGKVIANNGGQDFFGNTLYNGAPDIGAHEFNNDPGPEPELIAVAAVTLDKTSLVLLTGDSGTLSATVLPDEVYDKEVVWSSSDEQIAQVTQSGQVKAVAAGKAIITAASVQDPLVSAKAEVTVQEPSAVFIPSDDAFVRDGSYAAANYGNETLLYVKNDAAGYKRKAYVKFDFGSTQVKEIESAKLRLYVETANGDAMRSVSVYATAANWSESTLTWNNAPGKLTFLGKMDIPSSEAKSWFTVDITDYMQTHKVDGQVSFLLVNEEAVSSGSNVNFASSESGNKPQLVILEQEAVEAASTSLAGAESAAAGSEFAVTLNLHGVEQIYAQDIILDYDADVMEFVSAAPARDGLTIAQLVSEPAGKLHLLIASQGTGHAVTGDKEIIRLVFKAKAVQQGAEGEISVRSALLGREDGTELSAVPSVFKIQITAPFRGDINQDGKVTVGDLALVAVYYGTASESPDWELAKQADVDQNGEINLADLTIVAKQILE